MKINPYNLPELINRSPNKELELWVCTYEQRSVAQKVLRKLPPTCVIVTLVESPNYRSNGIMIIDKNKQKSINLQSTTGKALHIYNNYEECKKEFNDLVFNHLEQTKMEKERLIETMNKREKDLEKLFVDTDYLMEKMARNK